MLLKIRIVGAILACISVTSLFAQKNTVTLSGKLINFSNQVLIEDLSEFQYLDMPSADRLVIPDSSGNFTISFKLSAANYFRMGRNILYLTPGDKLNMVIDQKASGKGQFTGIGATANTYLDNTPFPKAASFLEAGSKLKPAPQETLDAIMATATERTTELNGLTDISAEFKRLEQARIKADVLNSFNGVSPYAKFSKKLPNADDYIKQFNELAATTKTAYQKDFIDPSLMKLVVYRDVADDLIAKTVVNADVQKIKDYYMASALVDKMAHEGDKANLKGYVVHIDSIKTPAYREAVTKHLNELLKFGKGDIAVDFSAVDLNGKKVALSSLKGKIIYVDIWATWCGPCLAEMPRLEEVKAKYKDNPNVVFLSLSIDEDNMTAAWKANVVSRKADGYQWQINRNKLGAYNVTTIPRTFLIDKNFKVSSMSAPLPSAKDLSAAINQLLK